MVGFLIFIAVLVVIGLWVAGIYNGLVISRNAYKNAFAQIDVQLQRRFDLIPNLVEVARKYMAHERETLEAVIAAFGGAIGAVCGQGQSGGSGGHGATGHAQGQLNAGLGRLLAVAEAYPELESQ